MEHTLTVNKQVLSQQTRFSVPVPIDIKKDVQISVDLTKQNILQLLTCPNSPLSKAVEQFVKLWPIQSNEIELQLLLQTLLSPLKESKIIKVLEKALNELGDQSLSVQIVGATYNVKVHLIAPNYPVNVMRRPASWLDKIPFIGREMKQQRKKNITEATNLLQNVGQFLKQIRPEDVNFQGLDQLLQVESIMYYDSQNIAQLKDSSIKNFQVQQQQDLQILFDALTDTSPYIKGDQVD